MCMAGESLVVIPDRASPAVHTTHHHSLLGKPTRRHIQCMYFILSITCNDNNVCTISLRYTVSSVCVFMY